MSEYLYVCRFSNDHVKVGRSSTPNERIASHADRVACVGIEITDVFITECLGRVEAAEFSMISECAKHATKKNKNEWFEGLDFSIACEIAKGFANVCSDHVEDRTNRPMPIDPFETEAIDYVRALLRFGLTQSYIAKATGVSQPNISKIERGIHDDVSSKMYRALQRMYESEALKQMLKAEPDCMDRLLGLKDKEPA